MKNYVVCFLLSCFILFTVRTEAQVSITVNPSVTYQTIRGFGGSGAMASGYDKYVQYIADLMGATIFRFYMDGQDGTSVTDINNGTCVFSHWDGGTYGNFMKALKAHGVDTIVVTCWSPPACLKNNNSLLCGSLQSTYYATYGKFIADWIKDFEAKTTQKVYAFNVQNEPLFCEPYSSAILSAQEFGPCMQAVRTALNNAGLTHVKMHGPEHMGSYTRNSGGDGTSSKYIQNLLWNATYRNILDIYSVHSYTDGVAADLGSASGWSMLDTAVRKYTKGGAPMELWMTETDFQGTASWDMFMDMFQSMYAALKYGKVNAWLYWSMDGGNGMYSTGSPILRLYACMHFMRFIRPGYQQIECTENDPYIAAIAFKYGNDYTIVAVNLSTTTAKTFTFNNFTGKPAYFDMYRSQQLSSNFYEKCAYVGRFTGNSFDIPKRSVVTLYFKQSEPDVYWNVKAPQNLTATNVTDNSITVTWSAVSPWTLAGSQVNITGYVVYLNGVKKTSTPITNTTYTFTGLTKGTKYVIEVYTRDALYNESVAARIEVTTTGGVQPPPQQLDEEKEKLGLSPNPATHRVVISLPDDNLYQITFVNLWGEKVMESNVRNGESIEVGKLPAGVYVVVARDNEKTVKGKLIIE